MNKIESDLCKVVIYYILALSKSNEIKTWVELLSYSKQKFANLIANFPKNHPAKEANSRLKSLSEEQYINISNLLKNKIIKFYNFEQNYFSIDYLVDEEEVDILSDVIILSSEYQSMNDFLKQKIEIEKDKRLLFIFGRILCEKDRYVNEGKKLLIDSAEQGYQYAVLEFARKFKNETKFDLEKEFQKALQSKDKHLIEQFNNLLGRRYYYGSKTIQRNLEKAFECFNKSYNVLSSKEFVGKAYYYGRGTEKDYKKAYDIFKSIENRSSEATLCLGEMYRLGKGVKRNDEVAYNYYRKSAEKNNDFAQYQLGIAYLEGNVVRKDEEKAIYWLEKSAKQNNQFALYLLGLLYCYGENEGYNVHENKEYAIELLKKSAKQGHQNAQIELSKIYENKHFGDLSESEKIKNISNQFAHMDTTEGNYNKRGISTWI